MVFAEPISPSIDEICSQYPITESEEICYENYCVDYETNETTGEAYCVDLRDTYCRTNNITKIINDCDKTLYSGAMNYWDGSQYTPVNTTITSSDYGNYDYEMETAPYQAYFQDTINTGEAVKFVKDGYYFIYDLSGGKMQWESQIGDPDKTKSIGAIQSATASVINNTVRYNGSFLNTDVEYFVYNEMLKENFILNELPTYESGYLYLSYTGEIRYSDNLTIWANGEEKEGKDFNTSGRIELKDSNNDTIFFLPSPTATGLDGNVSESFYKIKVSDTKSAFHLLTPCIFLVNATYPVYIDPTVKLQDADTENLEDTHICSYVFGPTDYRGVNYGGNDHFEIGVYDASMLKFNISSYYDNSNIKLDNATLELYVGYGYPFCSGGQCNNMEAGEWINVSVFELYNSSIYNISDNAWDESNVTWFQRPVSGTDYNSTIIDTLKIQGGDDYDDAQWYIWDITEIFSRSASYNDVNMSIYINTTASNIDSGNYDMIQPTSKEESDYNYDRYKPIVRYFYTYTSDVNISTCTVLDSPNIVYYLDSDITDSSTSNCMDITANNVTLDCQGHTIDGNDVADYGIRIYRASAETTNITIRNCTLTDWDTAGIYLKNADGNSLSDVSSSSSSALDYGLQLYASDSNNITDFTSFDNGYGVYIFSSGLNSFVNSSIYNNTRLDVWYNGVGATQCKAEFDNVTGTDSLPIKFYNSTVNIQDWNNNASQIILCNADDSTISNITLDRDDTSNNCLALIDCDNVTVSNSTLKDLYFGIDIYYSNSNNITDMSLDSATYGMQLYYSDSNNVTNCSFGFDSGQSGMYFIGNSDNNTIKDSTFTIGDGTGVHIIGSSNPSFYNAFYNNMFNYSALGSITIIQNTTNSNYWNTTQQTGTREYSNGTQIGGNFYWCENGLGESQTCTDSDKDGFCDSTYQLYANNIDYLPLSDEYGGPVINTNQTIPATPRYGLSTKINANVTTTGGVISWVNFTLKAPNGTAVIDNTNGTNYDTDLWNSSSYTIDNYGTWTVNITAGDTEGFTTTIEWTFSISLGTLTVETPDADQDHEFSLNASETETYNLTLTTDGNSNNTINFTESGDLSNITICNVSYQSNPYTLENGSSENILVTITTSTSSPSGTYSGTITVNRTNDGDETNITVNFTISSLGAGDVDILNTTFAISGYDNEIFTRTFSINNSGTYNLTHCNMSLTTTVSSSSGWSNSDFTIEVAEEQSVTLTFTPSGTGNDNSPILKCLCQATASGGKDSDSIGGAIAIASSSGDEGGNGGGGSTKDDDLLQVLLLTDFKFKIYPRFLEPSPFSTSLLPNSTIQWKNIRIFNQESEPNKTFIPLWVWSCEGYENCLSDWCTFYHEDEKILTMGIPPSQQESFTLDCTIPINATMNRKYEGSILIYPKGYNKNISQSVRIIITPRDKADFLKTEVITQAVWGGMTNGTTMIIAFLRYPVICFSRSCQDTTLCFIELMPNPVMFNETVIFHGIEVWYIILTVLLLLFMFWPF